MTHPSTCPYTDRRIASLVQHGKERVVVPALELSLGYTIEYVSGFGTDLLGTFTYEMVRVDSQLDAARRKTREGVKLSGFGTSLTNEGSSGLDLFTRMVPQNVGLITQLDDRMGIEVVGIAQRPAHSGHLLSDSRSAVEVFAQREGFPQQQLAMRPESQNDTRIYKGITDWDRLRYCFNACRAQARSHQVFVEMDPRTSANPIHMRLIKRAAQDLLQ